MQNVNKVIGLLNDKAPDNHFLAYINPKEANVLKSMGASGKSGPFGIPSFAEDYGSFDSYGGMSSGYSGDYEGDAYGTTSAADYGYDFGDPDPNVGSSNNVTTTVSGGDIDSTYNASDAFFTPSNEPISFGDKVKDYFTDGGLIGVAARKVQEIFNPTNQYEGITGEDGYGEGDYISTVGDWAESRGLTTDYSSEDLETQAVLDKQAFDAGFRTQSFKDLYDSGDSSNLDNLSTSESEAINSIIPQASYVVAGQTPVESQVNKFFNSNPIGMGLSEAYENTYNTAKSNMAKLLDITPNTGQFGYSASPYGVLNRTNLATNPFNIAYLQERGLI